MPEAPWAALIGLAVLALVAAAAAAPLRGLRCPGAAVVGGVAAGLLLGPGILGRVAPSAYEHIFAGGVAQRIERDRLHGELDRAAFVAQHTGAESGELIALRQQAAAAEDAWRAAQYRDQRALRAAVLVLVALTLAAGGAGPMSRHAGAAMTIGGWAAALPGAAIFVTLHYWMGVELASAALAAAAVAIGPYVLPAADRATADAAEVEGSRLIETAGRIATLMAIVVAGWGFAAAAGPTGITRALPLVAVVVPWVLASHVRSIGALRESLLVPALAASATVAVEPLLHFALWPVVVVILASGDGRWLGGLLGASIGGGRRWLRSMRLVMGLMAAGPTQLAVAAIAVHTRAIEPQLALALVAGALWVEISVPLRRWMSRKIEEMEEE